MVGFAEADGLLEFFVEGVKQIGECNNIDGPSIKPLGQDFFSEVICKANSKGKCASSQDVVLLKTAGQMGNQLAQYAAAYSFAKSTGLPLYVYYDSNDPMNNKNKLEEFEVNHKNVVPVSGLNKDFFHKVYPKGYFSKEEPQIISHKGKTFSTKYVGNSNFHSVKESIKNGQHYGVIVINNYLQGEQFSIEHRDEITKMYQLKNIDTKKLSKKISDISSESSVCMHIRRGDMVGNKWYTPIEYNIEAIKFINSQMKSPKFYIFSDDIDSVKKELKGYKNIEYITGTNSLEDFYLLSKHCYNMAITRSSYSWWSAYLNQKEGFIVSPKGYNLSNPNK